MTLESINNFQSVFPGQGSGLTRMYVNCFYTLFDDTRQRESSDKTSVNTYIQAFPLQSEIDL